MTKPPDSQVFVQAVLNALGLDPSKKSEIARAFGLESYSAPRRVTRWLGAETGPRYDAMMAMLMKADWLTEEAWRHLRAADEQARQAELRTRRHATGRPAPKKKANE